MITTLFLASTMRFATPQGIFRYLLPPQPVKRGTEATRGIKRASWTSCQVTVYLSHEQDSVTASGRTFKDGPELTCAMPSNFNPKRKFGSWIQVEWRGRVIDVQVTDHCPKRGVIDLNKAAMQKLVGSVERNAWYTRLRGANWRWK